MSDLRILDHGTVVQFWPVSERGREWLSTQLVTEPWQWLGNTVSVEHRYALDIAQGAVSDGLDVELG